MQGILTYQSKKRKDLTVIATTYNTKPIMEMNNNGLYHRITGKSTENGYISSNQQIFENGNIYTMHK